jgi:hypothetical protein
MHRIGIATMNPRDAAATKKPSDVKGAMDKMKDCKQPFVKASWCCYTKKTDGQLHSWCASVFTG